MNMPRLHLALDTCFASKRWTDPREWMQIAVDAGITCLEASADNECDPLYTPPEVLRAWLDAVREASARVGARVVNLYSGHGTYATLGLAHPDPRVRDHIQHRWLVPMIALAAELNAGLGFYCHAFSQTVVNDPMRYAEAEADLTRRLAELARDAAARGLPALSIEQMYSPHQIPWTIRGAERLLKQVYANGSPLYLTLDVGHASGQRRFLRPSRDEIKAYLLARKVGSSAEQENAEDNEPWLGSSALYDELDRRIAGEPVSTLMDETLRLIDALPQNFADPDDTDPYLWIAHLGAYSSILHLQQTDGTISAHHPFTARYNSAGIITPERIFAALRAAYERPAPEGLPPRCADIYLTLEIYPPTAERPNETLRNIRESAAYWRKALPRDGMSLDALS